MKFINKIRALLKMEIHIYCVGMWMCDVNVHSSMHGTWFFSSNFKAWYLYFFKIAMPCLWINSVLLFLKAFPSTYWSSIIRAQLSGVRKNASNWMKYLTHFFLLKNDRKL